jgi:hypothetical protein
MTTTGMPLTAKTYREAIDEVKKDVIRKEQ